MYTVDRAAYEGDIVCRLRNWRGLHLAHSGELFEEAADEIASLRLAIRRLADQDATLSVCDGDVTVTMDSMQDGDERFWRPASPCVSAMPHPTLTYEERLAIEAAMQIIDSYDEDMDGFASGAAATLRSLLEKTKCTQ